MTWSEEDKKVVEEAILRACENAEYANGIDELFDGDTWVIDFYEIATDICDSLEDGNQGKEIYSDEFENYVRDSVQADINWFIENMIKVCKYRLNSNYDVILIDLDEDELL